MLSVLPAASCQLPAPRNGYPTAAGGCDASTVHAYCARNSDDSGE